MAGVVRVRGLTLLIGLVGCNGDGGEDPPSGAETTADGADSAVPAETGVPDGSTGVGTDGGDEANVDGSTSVADSESSDGSDSGEPPGSLPLPPAVTCEPRSDACVEAPTVEALWASYRKDYFLPESAYNEVGEAPTMGGRLQIAGIAQASGRVTNVAIDGEPVESLLVEPRMEWYHVWPTEVVAGEPIWVAFHSRETKWDEVAQAQLTVETTEGTAIDASFPVVPAAVPVTYVTTNEDRTRLLVHLVNQDDAPHAIDGLIVGGVDVLAAGIACVAEPTLQPGASAMLEVPLCEPIELGAPWTVAVQFENAPPSLGVGRVLKPFLPIETWPDGSDCPYPGVQQEHYERHRDAGFDTIYSYWGTGDSCGFSSSQMYNETAPESGEFQILVGDDFLVQSAPETLLTNTSGIAGFLTGDETDDAVYVDGVPQPQIRADMARRLWEMYPELPVYNGAKTNKKIGAFAGQVDIQGIDLYVAACAPHITQFGNHPPLRGAYDYLRNARNNHMPLPTWLYAQGLFGGWNKDGLGGLIHVQPDPQEILVQAFSVIAAGGKGIMWFQTSIEEADHAPARWDAIAEANWAVRGVRRFLREGDITGRASTTGNAIVEAIVAPGAIVVPVLNLSTSVAPDDIACLASFLGEGSVPHWILSPQTLDVAVEVPPDLGVVEAFEIADGGIADDPLAVSVVDRTVTIEGLALDNERPVRLLVLAAHEGIREEVAANLAP